MTCDEFELRLASYVNGALSTHDCEQMEAHASTCAACEERMERASPARRAAFAPTLPAELRDPVLRAVAARRAVARTTRWRTLSALLGTAALLVLMLRPSGEHTRDAVADSAAVPTTSPTPSAADDLSRSEFMALDDAARELEHAIALTPEDAQLAAFLQSVTDQRAALRRRVKDSRS